MLILSKRVQHLTLRDDHLVDPRHHLLPNRAIGIVAVDQVEKVRGNREGQLVVGLLAARLFLRGQRHQSLQLRHARDPMLELPGPVVPLALRDVWPETLALGPGGAVFGIGHRRTQTVGKRAVGVKRRAGKSFRRNGPSRRTGANGGNEGLGEPENQHPDEERLHRDGVISSCASRVIRGCSRGISGAFRGQIFCSVS